MKETILAQITALNKLDLSQLIAKYEELFDGEKPVSTMKSYIKRRLAYRIQELASGGLSDKGQGKIQNLIKEFDPVNNKVFRPENPPVKKSAIRNRRLPIPGTIITKKYKGYNIQVKVLEKGFEYMDKTYKSLTAIAREITGAHWNGYLFFGL